MVASAVAAALALSCSSDTPPGGGAGGAGSGGTVGSGSAPGGTSSSAGSGGASGSGNVEAVTWAEDIAPLVFRECTGCHRDGGIGPFALTSYAAARPFAHAAALAVADRYMPPMPVDNSGECNTYSNARWLSDDEIRLFQRWWDQGAPEGDPARTPAPPTLAAGLERTDATVALAAEYTPNGAVSDDYRCFVVDPGMAEDRYLVAYEVVPGDARVVHHAILFQPQKDSDAADAQALDAAEEGQGYTCFGASRIEADPIALWAPGGGPIRFPAGTGVFVAGGRKLVLQVHYNTNLGVFPDRTSVRLQLETRVDKTAFFQPIADQALNVAPGQELGMSFFTRELSPPTPSTVYGVLPHMHTLGRTLRFDIGFEEGSRCGASVDNWNFHWQNAWWYTTPLKGTVASVTLSCGFDTRTRTTPIMWGEGTLDEMCLVYAYVTVP
jgi:hypothetical protein